MGESYGSVNVVSHAGELSLDTKKRHNQARKQLPGHRRDALKSSLAHSTNEDEGLLVRIKQCDCAKHTAEYMRT